MTIPEILFLGLSELGYGLVDDPGPDPGVVGEVAPEAQVAQSCKPITTHRQQKLGAEDANMTRIFSDTFK